MIDIILKFPKSTIYIFRFSRQYVNKAVYRHIMCMVLAIILLRGHRTYANVSRLFMESRDKSCISRCFKNKVICQEHISSGQLKNRIQIKVLSKRSQHTPKGSVSAYKYETKTFITYTEKLSISKMGELQVVFSRKEKEDDTSDLRYMRYIVTDNLSLSTSDILTIYTYRWQIELYFKELKSYLGLGDYQMLPFQAIVRHVDCVIMTFMYLEHLRICKLKEDPKSKQWRYARTLQMSYVVQHELRMTNIAYLKRALKNGTFSKLEQKLMEKLPLVA